MPLSSEDLQALVESANRIGADPVDYGTAISYETGGKFDPSLYGGAGGRHLGLIQFGPAEQKAYGASPSQSFAEQLPAVEKYLTSRGFQPGMGMMDLYSTINAGSPGRFSASDAGNGGAPGTVADKVRDQMGGHRSKVAAMLGGSDFQASMPAQAGGPARPAGFGPSGPQQQAYPQIDPITRQPLDDSGGGYGDIAALLGGVSGAQGPAQPQPQQRPPQEQASGPLGGLGGPAPSLDQARASFDPSRFFNMLPRPRRRFG